MQADVGHNKPTLHRDEEARTVALFNPATFLRLPELFDNPPNVVGPL